MAIFLESHEPIGHGAPLPNWACSEREGTRQDQMTGWQGDWGRWGLTSFDPSHPSLLRTRFRPPLFRTIASWDGIDAIRISRLPVSVS